MTVQALQFPSFPRPAFRTGFIQRPLPPASTDVTPPTPTRLFRYIGPTQAIALLAAGFSASFALKLFQRKDLFEKVHFTSPQGTEPARFEGFITFTGMGDFVSSLVMGLVYKETRPAVLACGAASFLGYTGSEWLDYFKEVMVRKEETQILSEKLDAMKQSVWAGMMTKSQITHALRQKAKHRYRTILMQHHVPSPDTLLSGGDIQPVQTTQWIMTPSGLMRSEPPSLTAPRFKGHQNPFSTSPSPASSSPKLDALPIALMKLTLFGGGFLGGMVCQKLVTYFKQEPEALAGGRPISSAPLQFFPSGLIAAFTAFQKNHRQLLWALLGLTAGIRIAKSLVEGYREIETTRQHGNTEFRNQDHIRRVIDPDYFRMAEEAALQHSEEVLKQMLPAAADNRPYLTQWLQTNLSKIGQQVPWWMTSHPLMNIVPALTRF